MTRRHKVLIICGGGIFGCIPARFLSLLPTDKQTLKDVDLIAGCSIGGILAAAYSVGQPFGYVDSVFQARAGECFTKRFAAKLNPLASPVYRNDTIDRVIRDMIGDERIADIRKHYPKLGFVVPALDVTADDYVVFENLTHTYDEIKLADVAGFTSAAPTYFAGRDLGGHCIIDGGLIEVDPLMTAVTTLKRERGVPFLSIDVLMIGTGQDIDKDPLTPKRYNSLGLLGVATDVLVPYATLSNKLATRRCGDALGLGWFEYFNPLATDGQLDNVKLIPGLVKEADRHRDAFLHVWDKWLSR